MTKPAVTLRSVKDAALNYSELDTNFENLRDATIGFTVDSGTGRTAKTVTAQGDASYSTLQQKFGTGSMRFDGTGDYFTLASSIDFAYGTSDFTIEMWVYRQGTGVQILFDQRTSSATTYAPVLFINTTNQLAYTDGEGVTKIAGTTTVPLNTWSHVTVSRSGTSTKIFLNGSQEGSTYSDSRNYIQTPVRIGARWDATGGFNGHIDELRISKGLARYTANFTAPTTAFTNDSNTVLLLHADSTPIVDDPGVASINADIDLNSRLTVTAGTGITLALDPTTDTLTITNTQPAPDLSNYVTLDGTQTITGSKTLSGTTTLGPYRESVFNIGNSGTSTITPDFANGPVQTIAATGNFTLALPTNITAGANLTLIITQDATGARTFTPNASYKFANGIKTLSAPANSIDVMTIYYDGSRYLSSLIRNYS
jgi:hypothetical protein